MCFYVYCVTYQFDSNTQAGTGGHSKLFMLHEVNILQPQFSTLRVLVNWNILAMF